MGKTISQLTAQGAGARSKDDLFEIESSSNDSKKQTRQNGITILESSLIELNSSNKAINTTPIDLVAASGNALQGIIPIGIVMYLAAGGVAFDFGAGGIDVIFSTVTGTSIINIPQADINSASSLVKTYPVTAAKSCVFNDKVQLYSAADATTGNGTAYFRLLYTLQDFNP